METKYMQKGRIIARCAWSATWETLLDDGQTVFLSSWDFTPAERSEIGVGAVVGVKYMATRDYSRYIVNLVKGV